VALPIMLFRQEAADRPVTQSEPRVDAEPAPTRLDGVHVLAVDDEEDALALLSEILESSGAQVTTARSAAEALGILAAIRPHLILSDVGMPGVDGFEFIARVRQLSPAGAAAIPAVALTAYARSEDRTRALRAGFQMHLAKPIDPEELVAAIRALASRELLP
jgi:CheY-like chemotaxis protein